ncbi:MAG: SHOCT domain-containing protein [Bacillota bacterium]|nr:SHOCT domain-containing protein [Bacillota bacterium]
MLKHVLLLIFTFSVWYFIWNYRTTRYLNQVEEEPPRTPVNQLLLCLFVPFYHIYWSYKSAQRLDRLADSRGVLSDLQVLCLVLAFFVPILPPVLMQEKMNRLSGRLETTGEAPRATPSTDEELADRLRTYKSLLDDGLITQEDYDAKKAQILGL